MLMTIKGYYAAGRGSRRALGKMLFALVSIAIAALAPTPAWPASNSAGSASSATNFYLPTPATTHAVTVTAKGNAEAGVLVITEAVVTQENGPTKTFKKFGEVYVFSPSFIAVRLNQPMQITFWNLQSDDEHDFMLADPRGNVVMHEKLPPLSMISYIFTFHEAGIFNFYCAAHQPEMSGQILVLAPGK